MIHVLLPQASSYRDITEYLRERGARVTVIGAGSPGMSGKFAIVLSMFPRVMLSRIRPNSVSTAVCTRFGRASMRRAM